MSRSLAETTKIAGNFLSGLKPRPKTATVVALSGDLGSGKTTFVQACAGLLGVKEKVTSPTFVIMKSYKLSVISYKFLHHIDAYRLKSGEELRKLDFDSLLKESGNLIFIEWPENVAGALPKDVVPISFEFIDNGSRKIVLPEKSAMGGFA